MPAGGVLRISCKNVRIGSADPLPLDKGDYVKVSIQDQGTGIPKELLASIFDPYFTTKQKGSGLGLATSYSIVKKHDGLITVESEMGKGTIFDIFLPATLERANEQHEEEGSLVSGRGKILVMDDEDIVLEIITEMLKRLGYEVEGVRDGAEAIELYRKRAETGSPFVAVIMDLTIPGGMGGKEAIRQLRELYPEVKAIVSSGYSNDPIMAEYGEFGFAAVLAKPYKLADLSHALSTVITLRDNPC
jgi:CheY-like chemotaxis protein